MAFKNKTILQILNYYKDLWALSYTSAVAHWDLETYMPQRGAAMRGEALAKISSLRQKMFLSKEFVALIHEAGGSKTLSEVERGVVRILLHQLKFYEKIPSDFLEEFEKLTNTATVIWREAKEKSDFKLFEPSLSKIFDMNRRIAEYIGYKDSPYDALLDQYEEQLTVKTVEPFFAQIRKPLEDLLNKIVNSPKYLKSDPVETMSYDKAKMAALNDKVLKFFYKNFGQTLRLDISAHPFTTSFANSDTRITTWYHDRDFARSLLATIHEFGHALYDLQCADELEMTPIGGGSSLVIHESQSRFWENFIGRSREFIEYFKADFDSVLSVQKSNSLSVDEYLSYFNHVSPGPLRVEADEVTYHFHIMLRYEIEKGIIEEKLKVKDLQEIWNTKMDKYLGIVPKKASDGVLQDIHWSGGMIGYFPTYSLGTFLGAQWEDKIRQEVKGKSLNESVNKIEEKLGKFIHRYGSTYTLDELLKKNNMKYDPEVNIKYLFDKYSKIYNF